MSNMQAFYKKIKSIQSAPVNPYLSGLEKVTHLDPVRLQSVATDLWWTDWGQPIVEPAKN